MRRRLQIDPETRETLARTTEPRRDEAIREGAENDYGFDLEFRKRSEPVFKIFYESYWRVATSGMENVPTNRPVILVGNHPNGLVDPILVAGTTERVMAPG